MKKMMFLPWMMAILSACGSVDQPRTSTLIQSSPNPIGIQSSEQVLRLDQSFYQIELRTNPDDRMPYAQVAQVRVDIQNPKSLDLTYDQVRISLQSGVVGTSIKSMGARYRVSETFRDARWVSSNELWIRTNILIEAY